MPLLLELVLWTLASVVLVYLATGFALAVFQALRESYVRAALVAAMLALALWIVVILWPLRQAVQTAERLFGF